MVLEALNELPEDKKPLLVEFNPWEWGNSDKLTDEFFGALADEPQMMIQAVG